MLNRTNCFPPPHSITSSARNRIDVGIDAAGFRSLQIEDNTVMRRDAQQQADRCKFGCSEDGAMATPIAMNAQYLGGQEYGVQAVMRHDGSLR